MGKKKKKIHISYALVGLTQPFPLTVQAAQQEWHLQLGQSIY